MTMHVKTSLPQTRASFDAPNRFASVSERCDSGGKPSRHRAVNGWPFICAKLLVLAALALGLVACQHRPAGGAALELNDGRKWVVPPGMMVHIRNIETDIHNFEAAPAKDHATLASAIQQHLGRLVTNCTMEGKAHDELHKWLMPFLGSSQAYVDATALRVQEEKCRELQRALVVFNRYFE